MKNEKTYIEKVNDWLNADPTTRTIEEGAKLMLQGNRNRILYESCIRKNNFEKVKYELSKIINTRADMRGAYTANVPNDNIATLEAQVLAVEEKAPRSGKRLDHETLPLEIQQLVEQNRDIYHKMRSLFEKLKLLSGETYSPEKRLPFLTQLLEADAQLADNWNKYDAFDANAPIPEERVAENTPLNSIGAKRVSANRKYLSDNKVKLATLLEKGEDDKANDLLARMQTRFDELITNGETFAPDQVVEFKKLGIYAA